MIDTQVTKGSRARRLHYLARAPADGVGVEVLGGIEPQAQSLLPVPNPVNVHVSLNQVRLTSGIAQELKVELIVVRPV